MKHRVPKYASLILFFLTLSHTVSAQTYNDTVIMQLRDSLRQMARLLELNQAQVKDLTFQLDTKNKKP